MFNKKDLIRFGIISSAVIFLSLSSCSQARQENFRVPTETVTPQIHLTYTKTGMPTQIQLQWTLTPSLQPAVKCPISNVQAKIHDAGTGNEAEQSILDYLNQGGSIEQLQNEIISLGTIVDSSQVFTTDINSDGLNEIVVAVNFAPPRGGGWEDAYGYLSIYNCVNNSFEVTKIADEKSTKIKILVVDNLLKSAIPEILVSRQLLFFGGCDEFVEMFSLNKSNWVSIFKTEESVCEMKIEFTNNSDGYEEMTIEGIRGCSYSACGPARGTKSVYDFTGDEVALKSYELLPSPYRIHVLEDGDVAIRDGQLEAAIEIFDKAAQDSSLIDVLTMSERDLQIAQNIPLEKIQLVAHNYQTSFAYFRELVLYAYLNRLDKSESILAKIKIRYPDNESGNEFVDISSYFLEQIASGSSVSIACEATNDFIANEYILSDKDFVYPHLNGWGDLSPQIGEHLCPVVDSR